MVSAVYRGQWDRLDLREAKEELEPPVPWVIEANPVYLVRLALPAPKAHLDSLAHKGQLVPWVSKVLMVQ